MKKTGEKQKSQQVEKFKTTAVEVGAGDGGDAFDLALKRVSSSKVALSSPAKAKIKLSTKIDQSGR